MAHIRSEPTTFDFTTGFWKLVANAQDPCRFSNKKCEIREFIQLIGKNEYTIVQKILENPNFSYQHAKTYLIQSTEN